MSARPLRLQGRLGGIAYRAVWSFGAQATSSASSFLLTVGVLAASPEADFAIFSVCITTYLLATQLARSASGVPLTILYSHDDQRHDRSGQLAGTGAGLLVGMAGSFVLLVVAGFADRGRGQFLVLAAALPVLLYQDSARYLAFARAQPHVAAVSDLTWLLLQLAGTVACWVTGRTEPVVLVAVWAAAGVAAAAVAGLWLRVPPTAAGSLRWLRDQRELCGRLVVEFGVNSGSFYLLMYGLAAVAGVLELGHLRAAQTLMGPVIVVLLAGTALGVPESVRVRSNSRHVIKLCLLLAAGLAGAAVVWGAVSYVVLPWAGPRFFPQAWETARPLLPTFALYGAAVGASTGSVSGLRALGENRWILRARAASGGAALTGGLGLAAGLGALGVLAALAATEWGFAAASWRRLVRSSGRDPDPIPGQEIGSFLPA